MNAGPQGKITETPHEALVVEIDFSKLGMEVKEGEPGAQWSPNVLHDQGEQNILDVYFRNTNLPAPVLHQARQ